MLDGKNLTKTQQYALADITELLAQRLEAMGEALSGLYNYYANRLKKNMLLSKCDACVLQALRERRGQFHRVWEIGSGVGHLTAMMALDGHDVISVEREDRRLGALTQVMEILRQHDPLAHARVRVLPSSFPEVLTDAENVEADAVVVINCAFTDEPKRYRAFEDALPRFGMGLIDFPRLFNPALNRTETYRRVADFTQRYGVPAMPIAEYSQDAELFFARR